MSKNPPHPELLRQVAERFGTPTYVYFEESIRRNCRRLIEATSSLPVKLLYAMKANFNPAILRIIREEGFGLDVVSPGEWHLAQKVGFSPADVLYSANHMSRAELLSIAETGVLINFGELNRLDDFGHKYPGSNVCLRLNPELGSGHHEYVVTAGNKTKFGIPLESLNDARDIIDRHGLKVIALHEHIGSGFLDVNEWWAAIKVLLNVAQNFPNLQYLNFGGGLGIAYREEEQDISLETFEEKFVPQLIEWRTRFQPTVTFMFEPGRFVVAESGTLLTQVTSIKQNGKRTIVGTDTGLNQLIRPMLYGAYHEIVNLSQSFRNEEIYDITGNICETGDRLAIDRPVGKIEDGDLLACLDAGAYGISMASWYNLRGFPAEVLIDSTGTMHQIRRRLAADEIVQFALTGTQQ